MKTKAEQRWGRLLIASIILTAVARGAYALEPVASVTTSDGTVYTSVKVLRVVAEKVLLSYSGGAVWVPLDSLSDDARKSLGLRTRAEQAAFEAALSAQQPDWREVNVNPLFLAWLMDKDSGASMNRAAFLKKALQEGDVNQASQIMGTWKEAQREAERQVAELEAAQEQARVEREARTEHWRELAMRRLDDPNLRLTFTGADGTTIRKESSLMTPEEGALYIKHYIELHEAVWHEETDRDAAREDHGQNEAQKSLWRQEALKSLEGANHEVSLTGTGGKTLKKASSLLTPEERALYVRQYVTEHEAAGQAVSSQTASSQNNPAAASKDNGSNEAQWQEEAKQRLDGPSHRVSFPGPDGTIVRKDSSSLTPEERALYIRHYVELHDSARRAAAARSLAGPNHEVSFPGPDGTTITKDSSSLTPAERSLYLAQYGTRRVAAIIRRDDAEMTEAREEHWRYAADRLLAGPNHSVSFPGPNGQLITKDSSSLTPEERALYIRHYVQEHAAFRSSPQPPNATTTGQNGTVQHGPSTAGTTQAPAQGTSTAPATKAQPVTTH